MCLWNDHWHRIARPDNPILGDEIPWLHWYDSNKPASRTPTPQPNKGKETASNQSIDDLDQKTLNEQIRQSPTNIQTPLPAPSSAWKTHFTLKYDPPATMTQMISETETKLTTSFDKAFKRADEEGLPPPEWKPFQGGPPGGKPLGPGGDGLRGPPGGPPGGPDGGNPNLPTNLQPVPQANDTKAMGELPDVFNRDRTKAESFIDQLNHYFLLNLDILGFNSPIKKVALAIILIKGPDVMGWTRVLGELFRALDPIHDNIPALWEHFE